MRVAPELSLVTAHITTGNIHPTDEPNLTIDDANLAVIAIIHFPCEQRKPNRHERMHLDTLLTHTLKETVLGLPRPHIIIDKTHFDTLREPCR